MLKFDFGSWFDLKYKDEKIVLFEEFAKKFLSEDLTFAIELKTIGIEKQTLEIIDKYSKSKENIYITSFIFEALEKEHSSMNFDKYMNNFYEELRKSKLKKALKDFKEDDFETLKNKINRTFEESTNIFESKETDLEEAFNEFYKEAEQENYKEIHLGFKGLNDCCTFENGGVVLIAGNTGMGKTAFALDMILKSISSGKHKILFV